MLTITDTVHSHSQQRSAFCSLPTAPFVRRSG